MAFELNRSETTATQMCTGKFVEHSSVADPITTVVGSATYNLRIELSWAYMCGRSSVREHGLKNTIAPLKSTRDASLFPAILKSQ